MPAEDTDVLQRHPLDAVARELASDGHRSSSAWHALPAAFRVLAAETPRSVLLETAKQDGDGDKSLLFLDPRGELIAWTAAEMDELLTEVDRLVSDGAFLAGFFGYECGDHFIGLAPRRDGVEPLAWLGVFGAPIEFDHRSGVIRGVLPEMRAASHDGDMAATIHTDGLQIAREDYDAAIASIHGYLHAGDTYQVNFTDRIEGETDSDALTVYQTLLRQQPVPFAAYIDSPFGTILSFSPELFFRTTQRRICVRPMKGTWRRGVNFTDDEKAQRQLRHDEKNRSEHVMIVDLLRNDLGRICRYGSVHVDELFHVERYNTLLQMTSTCSGQLRDGVSPSEVLVNLFPCGSITGAPKRRSMEIIRELERRPRGVYSGCIGFFGPDGEACFNVAIRTVKLEGRRVSMGVGGGITADSKAEEEFAECRLKAEFLTRRQPSFSLIETMRGMDGEIPLLPRHMQRLSASARYFGMMYDESALWRELVFMARDGACVESKVRLMLHQTGDWTISVSPLDQMAWSGRLLLAEARTCATDVSLHHKTTCRDLYERSLAEAHARGFDEVIFLNKQGELTEGAISNLFLQVGEQWMTPSLQCGVLPGIQRAQMLEHVQHVEERTLRLEDLAGAESVYVCNALRGVRVVVSVEADDGSVLWTKK